MRTEGTHVPYIHTYIRTYIRLTKRGQCNLSHRLSCGWFKFHCFQHSLLNRKIPVHLRLRLFESVVSPTVLYSLSSTPLTATQQQKLDATQRKMLRRIVGWVHHSDEDWHGIGARMKARLDAALVRSPVRTWSEARNRQRERLLKRIETDQAPDIVSMAARWVPDGQRKQGRPFQRWWG